MRNALTLLFLTLAACSPDLTKNFVGEWSVTTGMLYDQCPPPQLSGSTMHNPGDTTLSIAASDHETLTVKLGFHKPGDPSVPTCELVAIATTDTSAGFQAKSCILAGTRYDILEGSLGVTQSGALLLDYNAVVGNKDTCQRTESATFVPK